MTENGTKPDQVGKTWAEVGPSPYPSPFPPDAKADVGWQPEGLPLPEDPGEIIPADWWNGIVQYMFRAINWIAQTHPREFSALDEGIGETTYPQRFIVHPPLGGMSVPWVQQWGGIGQGGSTNAVTDMAADGSLLYYCQNSTLYAETPEDGAALAGFTPIASRNICETDGFYLYAAPFIASTTADVLNRLTGALVGSLTYGGTAKVWNQIAANGSYACAVYDDDAENIHLTIWSNVGATPVHVADKSHGLTGAQNVYAVCMDHEWCFIGGVQGDSAVDVRAFRLSDGAQQWAMSTGAVGVIVRSLATDGELVYVACDQATINGALTNCFALSRQTGAIVWQYNALFAPAQFNASRVRVDDRFVYISGGAAPNEHTLVMLKHLPGAIQEDVGGALAGAVDGAGLFVFGNIDTRYRRIRGGASREFMRGKPDDPARRPFHNLAVPTQGG